MRPGTRRSPAGRFAPRPQGITPADVAAKPIHILLRDLAEKDPPKPSTIEPAVQGDLDWIALKALERDPNRRYGSADDPADDITRYLSFEPITARHCSWVTSYLPR